MDDFNFQAITNNLKSLREQKIYELVYINYLNVLFVNTIIFLKPIYKHMIFQLSWDNLCFLTRFWYNFKHILLFNIQILIFDKLALIVIYLFDLYKYLTFLNHKSLVGYFKHLVLILADKDFIIFNRFVEITLQTLLWWDDFYLSYYWIYILLQFLQFVINNYRNKFNVIFIFLYDTNFIIYEFLY